MKKETLLKRISLAMSLVLMLCLVPSSTFASSSSDFVIENGELKDYIGTDSQVEVPYGVTSVDSMAFVKKNVTSVVFPETVKTIECGVFRYCRNLTDVTFKNPNIVHIQNDIDGYPCEDLQCDKCGNGSDMYLRNMGYTDALIDSLFSDMYTVEWQEKYGPLCESLTIHGYTGSTAEKLAYALPAVNTILYKKIYFVPLDGNGEIIETTNLTPANRTASFKIGKKSYTIDGTTVKTMDAAPYIDSNSRTMVPLRYVADALGVSDKQILWHENNSQVIILNKKVIDFMVGMKFYWSNWKSYNMDTTAVNKGGRIYVPIKYAAEALGATVGWDETTQSVTVTLI